MVGVKKAQETNNSGGTSTNNRGVKDFKIEPFGSNQYKATIILESSEELTAYFTDNTGGNVPQPNDENPVVGFYKTEEANGSTTLHIELKDGTNFEVTLPIEQKDYIFNGSGNENINLDDYRTSSSRMVFYKFGGEITFYSNNYPVHGKTNLTGAEGSYAVVVFDKGLQGFYISVVNL